MASNSSRQSPPPYVSFRTLLNFLDKLDQGGPLPQYIDRHYWGIFLGGSIGPQVVSALRFLNLVEGEQNEPTDTLARLVNPEQRKAVLAEVLRDSYAPIFAAVDLPRATQGQLDAEFGRCFKLSGDTRRKAVTFFVHAVEHAEIPLSKHVQIRKRQSSQRTTAKTRRIARNDTPLPSEEETEQPSPKAEPTKTISPGRAKTISFSRGGNVTLTYDVDLFSMDRNDREFLLSLIDALTEYQERANQHGESIDDRLTQERESNGSTRALFENAPIA